MPNSQSSLDDKISCEFPEWKRVTDDKNDEFGLCPRCGRKIKISKQSLSGVRKHDKLCSENFLKSNGRGKKRPHSADIQAAFDASFLKYVVHSDAVLKTADDKHFRAMIQCLNGSVQVPSRPTLSRRIATQTQYHYERVKDVLATCPRVHISLDPWSRSSRSSYLCAIGHAWTQDGLRQVLLDFRRITGKHTASNIRIALESILDESNINAQGTQLGAIVSDAASSNVRMVKDLRADFEDRGWAIPHILCCGQKLHLVITNSLELWTSCSEDTPDQGPRPAESPLPNPAGSPDDSEGGDTSDLDDLIWEAESDSDEEDIESISSSSESIL
ncbi:hypothetical protein FOZ62_018791 [Perkinsus olseni]|uniref:Uncharacterized protein n=1 Tax=Perkinsus olseni TaxID=32597 RepID=A0A7J6T0J0_PEROL|nr:hypothetical protein FOZ62_018791 [Perkinsus olseni]